MEEKKVKGKQKVKNVKKKEPKKVDNTENKKLAEEKTEEKQVFKRCKPRKH